MAETFVSYTGDGTTQNFTIAFPYILPSHVKVLEDGVPITGYSFASETSIHIDVPPLAGSIVLIKRTTQTQPLVDFMDGAPLTEQALDMATLQAIYIAQEAYENALAAEQLAAAVGSANASVIAATAKALEAAASAVAAASSAASALASKNAAAASAASLAYSSTEAAVEGTLPTTVMSPARVKEAILANIPTVDELNTADWQVSQSGTSLHFKYAGVTVLRMDSNGSFFAKDNVAAYGGAL